MALAMTDKLSALRRQTSSRSRDYTPLETLPSLGEEPGDHQINTLLLTVDELTKIVNQIGERVERVKQNHSAILVAYKNQTAVDDNEVLMKEIKELSHRVHTELKKMKLELERDEGGPSRNDADVRIRKAQYTTLSRRFRDLMADYNQVQEEYREKCKERIQRQLQYTGKQVSEERLEEMIESENIQVFTQDILLDTAQKRAALGEVEARHVEIMHLEANIMELHEMFYDMAILVEEQGELIDVIERNVETAGIFVHRGKLEIKTAVRYQTHGRRLKCIICCVSSSVCCVLLVVCAAIAGIVVYLLLPRPQQ